VAATHNTDALQTPQLLSGEAGASQPLSNGERIRILQSLLQHSAGGKLHRGIVAAVAVKFGVSRHCVGAIWKRGGQDSMNFSTSEAAAIPRTTLWERMKAGAVKLHTAYTKPNLSDENKVCRVEFCKAHIGLLNHR
jgi:hypothetical protein